MPKTLGAVVRELRLQKGIGLRALAAKANVDSGAISRLENGHQATLRAENLASVAQALGVTATELKALTEDPSPDKKIRQRVSVLDAIAADPDLTEAQREALRAVYRSFFPSR